MTDSSRGSVAGGVVIVSGAASGIGRATAERLVADGATVVGVDVDEEALNARLDLAHGDGHRLVPVVADVTSSTDVDRVVDAARSFAAPLRGLVNVVGGARLRDVADMDLAWWEQEVTFNLTSVFLLCRAALPPMRSTGGSIVNLSSGWGFRPAPGRAAYAASKAGIVAFSRSLAAEVSRDGIRVNVVAPGPIRTERMLALTQDDELAARAHASVPLERMGEPHEVAAAIAFLLGDEASYMTGQTLHVNGGVYMP